MVKETLSARISESTFEDLEEYAEERGMSKSEATDRLVDKALKIENGDVEIYPVSSDGGSAIEENQTSILDQLEGQQKILENTIQQKIQDQQTILQDQQTVQRHLNIILFLSIFWLAVHLVYSIPALATVLTGAVLIGGLSYSYLEYWRS